MSWSRRKRPTIGWTNSPPSCTRRNNHRSARFHVPSVRSSTPPGHFRVLPILGSRTALRLRSATDPPRADDSRPRGRQVPRVKRASSSRPPKKEPRPSPRNAFTRTIGMAAPTSSSARASEDRSRHRNDMGLGAGIGWVTRGRPSRTRPPRTDPVAKSSARAGRSDEGGHAAGPPPVPAIRGRPPYYFPRARTRASRISRSRFASSRSSPMPFGS